MSIESAIVGKLKADVTVASLVADRISPAGEEEGDTFPYVVYQVVSRPQIMTYKGPVALNNPRMQLVAWSTSYSTALAVANAIKAALSGFIGTLEAGAVAVRGVFVDDGDDDYSDPIHGEATGAYGVRITLVLWNG